MLSNVSSQRLGSPKIDRTPFCNRNLSTPPGCLVVTLSRIAARGGSINFGDLHAHRAYKPMPVYSQSKLACLLFALELDRRSQQISWDMRSFAAHPGISRTNLWLNASGKYSFERMMP